MRRLGAFASIGVTLVWLAAAWAAPAGAAADLSQQANPAGCITEDGASGLCQNGRGLVGPASIDLSPDGHNAYVASSNWNSVSILSRDPASGALTPISSTTGCLHSTEMPYPDCAQARDLGGAGNVVVSPDGANVYVAAPLDEGLAVFDRDPATGLISQPASTFGCVNATGSSECATGRELNRAASLAISPDGTSLYVASSGDQGGVAIFDRDPLSGALTQKAGSAGCINPGGVSGCAQGPPQLIDSEAVQVSPDGNNVYVVSRAGNALTIYDRAPDGALSIEPGTAGCISAAGGSGCQQGTALLEPVAVSVSPDGANVYVGGERSDSIAIFDRDQASGAISQKPGTAGCVSNTGASDPTQSGSTAGACQNGDALDGVDSIAVAPGGEALYATAANSSAVAVFERGTDGSLAQRPGAEGCITDTGFEDPSLPWTAGYCADGTALNGADGIIASGDGHSVYTTALNGGVGVFDVTDPSPGAIPQTSPTPAQPLQKPGGNRADAACSDARADLHRAQSHLASERSAIRRLAHSNAAAPAGSDARALQKHRRLAATWTRRLRFATELSQRNCPST